MSDYFDGDREAMEDAERDAMQDALDGLSPREVADYRHARAERARYALDRQRTRAAVMRDFRPKRDGERG